MAFKIKDGVDIGNVEVFNSAGTLLVNAPTATKLAATKNINGVAFDGSADITITANTPNSLTNGSYLTGSAFDGSAAVTFAVDATDANTASKVVARDASGNFSANIITASLTGNASTATKFASPTTINGVSYDGSANITITANTPNALSVGTYLISSTGNAFDGGAATSFSVDATNANTASKIVARDADGQFSTQMITLGQDPTNALHAATKQYVDSVAEGLTVKPAVKVATTANLTGSYDNGTLGVGATLNLGPATTLTIDGNTTWALYDGVLVKNQTNKAHNGRYYVSQLGNASTAWILTRCGYCDEATEIPSAYVFVQEGTTQSGTGWVAYVQDFSTFTVGEDDITFFQFIGQGTYTAGAGLVLVSNEFAHADTSSAENLTASSRTYVTGLTFDTFGHVTGYTTGSETVTNTNTTYSISTDPGDDAYSEKITLTAGGSGSGTDIVTLAVGAVDTVYGLTIEETGDIITFKHADTSSVSNLSSDNSGGTFIQDISFNFDTYGHVTSASVATGTVGDGTLATATGSAGATNTTVALELSGAYSANTTDNRTIKPVVGPAITNLATTMTGATTGFLKKTAADTYALDTAAYLTAETDTLATVTGRGATTSTGITHQDSTTNVFLQRAKNSTLSTTNATIIDSWAIATYRSCKYIVQVTQGTNYQVSEIMVIHNGTTPTLTEYAVIETNGSLATFSVAIASNNVNLSVVMGAATATTIKISATLMYV